MTVLAVISIIGSVLVIFGLAVNGILGNDTPLDFLLVNTGSIADVLLDTVCISLSIKSHEKYYLRFCHCLNWRLKKCCVKLTDRVTRKKEMELAVTVAADQNSQSQDTQTNSQNSGSSTTGSTEIGLYAQ